MKQQLVIVLIISLCSLFLGCKDKNDNYGVSYRPDNFPEILILLDGAIETRYLSPETGRIVEGTYSIKFWLMEEYPAPNTIEQIQSYLKKQGCVRVEWVAEDYAVYDIVENNDLGKKSYVKNDQEIQDLHQSLKNSERPSETQWHKPYSKVSKVEQSNWSEEWITKDDSLVSIHLSYYWPEKGYEVRISGFL